VTPNIKRKVAHQKSKQSKKIDSVREDMRNRRQANNRRQKRQTPTNVPARTATKKINVKTKQR
jgi:hypothetical protein